MESLTDFNHRISSVPDDWKQPLIDIIDTISSISIGIQSELRIDDPVRECPGLLLSLTKMAIERQGTSVAYKSDVIDTISAISIGIQSELNIDDPIRECPCLLLDLTKMAIETHDTSVI